MTLSALGIFSAAGAGGVAAQPAFELISTNILGSDQSAISFNISSFASTYKHIQIRGTARCTNNSTLAGFSMRLDSDAGTNYSNHSLDGVNSGTPGASSTANSTDFSFYIPGGTSSAGTWAGFVTDILDIYSTTKNKAIRTSVGFNAPGSWNIVQLTSGAWRNLNAVSTINLAPNQSNLLAGSRFSIYGVKG
jgi:hypothetical protein